MHGEKLVGISRSPLATVVTQLRPVARGFRPGARSGDRHRAWFRSETDLPATSPASEEAGYSRLSHDPSHSSLATGLKERIIFMEARRGNEKAA
jgi:hypothetical protein